MRVLHHRRAPARCIRHHARSWRDDALRIGMTYRGRGIDGAAVVCAVASQGGDLVSPWSSEPTSPTSSVSGLVSFVAKIRPASDPCRGLAPAFRAPLADVLPEKVFAWPTRSQAGAAHQQMHGFLLAGWPHHFGRLHRTAQGRAVRHHEVAADQDKGGLLGPCIGAAHLAWYGAQPATPNSFLRRLDRSAIASTQVHLVSRPVRDPVPLPLFCICLEEQGVRSHAGRSRHVPS